MADQVGKTDNAGAGAKVPKSPHALREERILAFWKEKGIFEKSLQKKSPKGEYTFYDGPPFATGTPHYGHILASAIKDAVPRFWTMRGYHVNRRWGWDCHGLPIENIVEKDLKISGRKQIEEYGVGKFNEYARSKVLDYVHEWKKTVDRMGRWVDFDGSYKTMDNTYIESVWWAFNEIFEKGLIYEGTRVLPYCPRCETPIANSEIAMDNSYKDIKDISVYVKFKVKDVSGASLLAWTTTPWTLPGNFALAINPKIDYVKIKTENGDLLILAKERLGALKEAKYEVLETFSGAKLVGLSYEPLFNYFTDRQFKNKENAWKVYGANFVTTTDGTGIVHIAPGYGEDDMKFSLEENIPFIHHVTHEGKFTADVKDFAGLAVKPKNTPEDPENHLRADIQVVKYLNDKGSLYAKESIRHSYPHCYRCETPLYYYAIPAWFIKISKVKSRMLKLNKKINWVPEHLKLGRFGKSMEGAPDWNISRNRFWASPLPIWKCESCKETRVLSSVEEIKKVSPAKNAYYVMRHGEAENNTLDILDSSLTSAHHLTTKGREQVAASAKKLTSLKIDYIITSPILRTKETAEIVKSTIGLNDSRFIIDERVREYNVGIFEGKPVDELGRSHAGKDRWHWRPEGGEDYMDIKKRMGEFIYDIDSKYQGKNILIVTHETPAGMLFAAAAGYDIEGAKVLRKTGDFMANAEIRPLPFAILPHNADFELDLHRPYIDRIVFKCKCGGDMKRISEVMDCWFESGSMPFAAQHYPFDNKPYFKKHFPAQFVAEYIAQTRTWFYYMHAISTILFKNIPFENVVTTGNVLAEDGQKMSKSKKNFPDPSLVFDRYGADAVRFYLLSSPLMKSEDLNFCERDVDAVQKKVISRLNNVLAFYKLYNSSGDKPVLGDAEKTIDAWIISRLNQIKKEVTGAMENYELDKATRPFMDFTDDLSTWYLRRSRDRFKGGDEIDKKAAIATTRYVLMETAKLMAPFMPFLADEIYREVGGSLESVHLEEWPKAGKIDVRLLEEMEKVRLVASKGLEARMTAKINVRQPLASLTSGVVLKTAGLFELIRQEINVKEIIFDAKIGDNVKLDTTITPVLKEEGTVRELIRAIQDLRKERGLTLNDKVELRVETNGEGRQFIEKNEKTILTATLLTGVSFTGVQGEFQNVGGLQIKLAV